MENNENQTCENGKKHNCKSVFLIALMTFLGAFLAFYFLASQTMHHLKQNSFNFGRQLEKEFSNDFKKFKAFSQQDFKTLEKRVSAIHTEKYEDAYVIFVNLKAFNNDPNNIRFNVKGNTVTISGSIVKNKGSNENSYYFTESFEVPERIVMDEITKEKINDEYIITLPIKD